MKLLPRVTEALDQYKHQERRGGERRKDEDREEKEKEKEEEEKESVF